MKKQFLILLLVLVSSFVKAQDPHFTQFYSAPFTVNPAYTGVFEGKYRVMANYRQQWANISTPFTTAAFSMDTKIGKETVVAQNPFNVGFMFMNDRTMKGAFRSNYIMASGSYHVRLNNEGTQSLGVGLSGTYGNKKLDFSSLSFEQQFTSGGFDLLLPNGEVAMQNMKPFVTIGAGVLYSYNNNDEGTFFELGISGYHFNSPIQSMFIESKESLPKRFSVQSSFQRYINESMVLNLKVLYQNQATVEYVLCGFSLAKLIGEYNQGKMLGAGVWYRTGDALSPYVFMEMNRTLIGISYDITSSSLTKGPTPASSLEFSLQWRL